MNFSNMNFLLLEFEFSKQNQLYSVHFELSYTKVVPDLKKS